MRGHLFVVSGYAPGERRATTLVWASDMEEALLAVPWAWSATVAEVGGPGVMHATLAPWMPDDFWTTDDGEHAVITIGVG